MKNLIVIFGMWALGMFGLDSGKDSAVKKVNDIKVAKYKDSLAVVRNSRTTEPVSKPYELPCDTVIVHDTIETKCPEPVKQAFIKPKVTITSNGLAVLDRKNMQYKFPIKNSNPDSVTMLNDTVTDHLPEIKRDSIRVEPAKSK